MSTPFPRPEPEPVPQPPAPAPFPPKPVREPDPEGLPDEVPLPNPDENDSPPQHAGERSSVAHAGAGPRSYRSCW